MKIKFFAIIFFSLYFATCGNTQIKAKKNHTISNSLSSLSLDLQQQNIRFNFIWFNDYLNGLGSYKGNYSSKGQISSNINWQLSCKAKGKFSHSDGRKKMSLNNIGISVFCKNMDKKVNKTLNSPIPLSNKNKTLLISTRNTLKSPTKKPKNKPNKKNKDISETVLDDITIYWEMGTKRGKMNKKSLNQQKLKRGSYSVDIEFILSEKL